MHGAFLQCMTLLPEYPLTHGTWMEIATCISASTCWASVNSSVLGANGLSYDDSGKNDSLKWIKAEPLRRPAICYLRISHTAQIFLTRPSVSSCVRHGCNPLEMFPVERYTSELRGLSWESLFFLPWQDTNSPFTVLKSCSAYIIDTWHQWTKRTK